VTRDSGHIRVVFEEDDCKTIALALRVVARDLAAECRRDIQGEALPDEVVSQATRLESIASKMDEIKGMNCCFEEWIRACDNDREHEAFALSSAEWQVMAAALDLLHDRLKAAGDRKHASRMAELAEKARGAEAWCTGLLDGLRQLRHACPGLDDPESE